MSFKSSLLAKYLVIADEMMDAIHEDYGIIKHDMEQDAKKAVAEISHLLPWTKDQIRIITIKSSNGRLGFYREGTESNPIILLNPKLIIKSAKKNNVDFYTAVASTVWHELGHAIISLAAASNVDDALLPKSEHEEEEWAEDMAYSFWSNGDLTQKIEGILDALEQQQD